jgi:hypothetical protein
MPKLSTAGLLPEDSKKIREDIKKAKARAKDAERKKTEQYKAKLLSLRNDFNKAIEEAKKDNLIPKTTTIAKIGMLPKKEPKQWATTHNRIFGRKKAKAKPKQKSIVSRISSAVSSTKSKKATPAKKKAAPAKKK